MKKLIKKPWKFLMRILLRVYTNNYSLYISNNIKDLENKKFYSQFGQDDYVLNTIFKGKKDGFFIDVGANHPINCSNTYLLEKAGWTGLAIEPQQSLRDLWPQMRNTKCLNYVIGAENKYIDFIEGNEAEHGLSGVIGFNKCKDDYKKISIEQKRLSDIISENSIKEIDYLSVDVEGYEMNVLESIDFDKVNIKLINVENDINFTNIPVIGKKIGGEIGNNKIRNYLKDRGYRFIARIVCDDFYIKE